jgi:HK97 family phage major capsid protein
MAWRSLEEAQQALEEARGREARCRSEITRGSGERVENARRGLERAEADAREAEQAVAEFKERREIMRAKIERGDVEYAECAGVEPPRRELSAARSECLRAIEAGVGTLLSTEAGKRIERFVEADPTGAASRLVAATADPNYERAFLRRLANPETARDAWTDEEAEAVRTVLRRQEERALTLGADPTGSWPLPAAIDPTVRLVSDGVLNPIRGLASVTTIAGPEWRGVTSDSIQAAFAAEGTEVADSTPSAMGQPVIRPERAQIYVEASIEWLADWSAARGELLRLFADGKDVLESEKFLSGAGHASNEPEGLLTGATELVSTASGTALTTDDCYELLQAIPPRFAPRASVVGNPAIFDLLYQQVGGGSTEPPVLPTREGPLLGRPKAEWSEMDSTTSSGDSVLVAGDFDAGFKIVDRIGMTVELVQHVLGQNRRPLGLRGLYGYWRTSSGVIVPEALRVLVMATS